MSGYTGPVREYLAYCRWTAPWLAERGFVLDAHPSEAGACKFIPHGGDATRAKEIRAAFREVTETPATTPQTT